MPRQIDKGRNGRMTAGRDSGRDVDMRLLELLACPLTKGPLVWNAERGELVSKAARLAYPVRDGIPIMLSSEARALSDDES
jgi:uncharacterized protein YbaR (Trm112 family)